MQEEACLVSEKLNPSDSVGVGVNRCVTIAVFPLTVAFPGAFASV